MKNEKHKKIAEVHEEKHSHKPKSVHKHSKKKKLKHSLHSIVLLRFFWFLLISIFLGFILAIISITSVGKQYHTVSLPGINIGKFPVGEMKERDLITFFQEMNEKLTNQGVTLTFNTGEEQKTTVISPTILNADKYINLIQIDPDLAARQVFAYGKTQNNFILGVQALRSKVNNPSLKIDALTIDKARFSDQIIQKIGKFEQEAKNSTLEITSIEPFKYTITTSTKGVVFNHNTAYTEITNQWSMLKAPEVVLHSFIDIPEVNKDDVQKVVPRAKNILVAGDLDILYDDPQSKDKQSWKLSVDDMKELFSIEKLDNEMVIALDKEKIDLFLTETVLPTVDKTAQNAKFTIGPSGRVDQFASSQPGLKVDTEKTYTALNEAILQRYWHDKGYADSVNLVVDQTEPTVKTGEVNDLGISEILGVGYSNFSGSPSNRVKNIRFAIEKKLNGLLIKPGDEFSMLDSLKPFTLEEGYLSELVIKGDEIKPEVGGGLCQVGSTMFRAAMNSGLEITERRNHSLVVGYYNDHRNNLPGTDATIYDNAPDFKFKNDTASHVLITTEMNVATGDLFFTLWGTNDGRKGYYTEPIVNKWVNPGPVKEIETTKLAPGERKCQAKHPGASTSFTYVKEVVGGEKKEVVFDSYYRPLPEICLVGVAEETEGEVDPNYDPLQDLLIVPAE